VWEKVGAWYCDYRTVSTFAAINVQKNKLKIFIKMGDKKLKDPRSICEPIPSTYGYGLLNTQFVITKMEDIEYAMTLIMQAYDYVTG
jgi:predicted transport protein